MATALLETIAWALTSFTVEVFDHEGAEILFYSRSCGLFAGISLSGSTLRADNRANVKGLFAV
jgi:lipid-binding SYLF domain-containing protein